MSNDALTIPSLLDELDQAIAESIQHRGLTAHIDNDYSDVSSAVLELRDELQRHLRVHGDGPIQALNAVHITAPLLAWQFRSALLMLSVLPVACLQAKR